MNQFLLYQYRIGYRKGIGNIRRVSEMYEGYRKFTKGIGNIRRVSEMYEGYRKIKKLNAGFQ
jgi:hypothetical protein